MKKIAVLNTCHYIRPWYKKHPQRRAISFDRKCVVNFLKRKMFEKGVAKQTPI